MSILYDVVCFSHLRWDFVYQRPQHLLARCARERRVLFVEEPVFGSDGTWMDVRQHVDGPLIAVPHLPAGLDQRNVEDLQRALFDRFLSEHAIERYVCWYYTPMALGFTEHLRPIATVYDCMDELSGFAGAPPRLRDREQALFARADLVFTGGHSLYESKRSQHPHVHLFPSSVDAAHFGRARLPMQDPSDQIAIPQPRLGFYGVIDERLDLELLAVVADARPEWQLIMVGPVVKIEPSRLPQRDNLHYLGGKSYSGLPGYVAGWDVALLPFAHCEATRYISPTKTPEYLAAGKPVVSTSIRDVVRTYAERGLVLIADTPGEFVAAVDMALAGDPVAHLEAADAYLATTSWDRTWVQMNELIQDAVTRNQVTLPLSVESRRNGAATSRAVEHTVRA